VRPACLTARRARGQRGKLRRRRRLKQLENHDITVADARAAVNWNLRRAGAAEDVTTSGVD